MHDHDLNTFVSSDHGFAPQFLAIDASKVLVNLGLLSTPQTANCRPATGETIGKAKACYAGGALQVYLNQAGRDPVNAGVPAGRGGRRGGDRRRRSATPSWRSRTPTTGAATASPRTGRSSTAPTPRPRPATSPTARTARPTCRNPTRTGDLVVFAYPPYQFDADTPGTLIARSAFFGQHGYVPDVQDLKRQHQHARDVPGRRPGDRARRGRRTSAASTSRQRPRSCSACPSPSRPRASCARTCSTTATTSRRSTIDRRSTTSTASSIRPRRRSTGSRGRSAARACSRRCSTRRRPRCPSHDAAALGRRQRRRLAAELGAAGGHADDRRRERLGAGRDRVRQPRVRLRRRRASSSSRRASDFPWLSSNIVQTANGQPAVVREAVDGDSRQRRAGRRDRRDRAQHARARRRRATPPGCRSSTRPTASRRSRRSCARRASRSRSWSSTRARPRERTRSTARRRRRGRARSSRIVDKLQDTTIDLVVAGHTHRVANTMVGHIPVVEGVNAGAHLHGRAADGRRRRRGLGRRARRAWPRTSACASRPDVQAIVDKANADTAVLRNQVIGTQSVDLRRDPDRLKESNMGNLVADAMRAKYPGVDAAITNSGGLRQDILITPPLGRRAARRDHLGRGVRRAAVRQPHGDRDAHRMTSSRRRSRTATSRRAATWPAAPAARRRSRA